AFDHKTVERELAVETPVNVTGDVLVPDLRVRVVRGHDAAQAQILDPNAHRADAQAGAWPLALGQPVDAADHDVRPQATMVVTEGSDGAVGGHQQRQHVEALNAVVAHQLGARPDNVDNLGSDLRTVPRPVVDKRLTIPAQCTLMTQETRMRARGDHLAPGVLDVYDPVAFDAERPEVHPVQLLTGPRLDRVSPDFRDLHRHLRCLWTARCLTAVASLEARRPRADSVSARARSLRPSARAGPGAMMPGKR